MKYLFLILIICTVVPVQAAQVGLAWEYKVDTKLPINGFRVYYGKVSKRNIKKPDKPWDANNPAPYGKVYVIEDPKAREVRLKALDHGKYYIRMITTTKDGSTSEFSEEISVDIRPLPAPTGLEIVITITR